MGVQLVVEDIDFARKQLVARGVEITEVQQLGPKEPRIPVCLLRGPGRQWLSLQEIKRG